MTYEYIQNLKNYNQTLKLLNSDHIAMVLSFLYAAFIQKKNITLKHSTIINMLDDYLYALNQSYEDSFVRSAKEYLEEFSSDKNGYLRKYHGSDDEPLYELTTYSAKALEFIQSLEKREFVGSRSKFNVVFELLEELNFETSFNDEQRIQTLQKQKADIDKQIEAIKNKQDIRFDSSRIKEHFMLLEETARKLKYDFSEIEYNFRDLNQLAMEQIASREDAKAEVLGSIFDIEDSIREQDQGKSFYAFWQLLTDTQKSEQLSTMIENLYLNEVVQEFDTQEGLKNLKYELLQSGKKVSQVSSKLIEQLRRYIDDRAWMENRRILELCKSIEKTALNIKENAPKKRAFFSINGVKANIKAPFENSLYKIKEQKALLCELEEREIEVNLDTFYQQFFIDEAILQQNIKKVLLYKEQCTLEDINKQIGITKGVAEIVGYLSIAKNSSDARVDENIRVRLNIRDFDGETKIVSMPLILFVK